MKYISRLIILLTFICNTTYFSQKNAKEYSLKVKDISTVTENGKTSWLVNTILTNHSRDTLFYFSFNECEAAFYNVKKMYYKSEIKNDTLIDDGNSVSINLQKCGAAKQTVISVPPSGQRIVNLEMISLKPLTSSFKFFISLSIYKAKNINQQIPHNDLMQKKERERSTNVKSKIIKIKPQAGKSNLG